MKFFLSNFLDKQKIEVLRNHLAKSRAFLYLILFI